MARDESARRALRAPARAAPRLGAVVRAVPVVVAGVDMKSEESSGVATRPAPWSAYETEPEQSYALSTKLPWPPPSRYGLRTIWLAA